jgi:ABC transporter substrate binding protein
MSRKSASIGSRRCRDDFLSRGEGPSGSATCKGWGLGKRISPGRAYAVSGGNPEALAHAAGTLGLEVVPLEIPQAHDIAPAFEALKDHANALYVCTDALLNANRIRINTLALAARLPMIHGYKESVEAGA